jgi:hypothetical protein
MSNDEPKGIPTRLWLLVIFSIMVALLLISLYFWKFPNVLAEKQDVWGQFGDYVGGILNPLFSLTALFALLYTIKLQSKELHESTEQLKASAEALALQNNVMVRQQFETTFFQMLGLFNEVVKAMELRFTNNASDKSFKGRLCIFRLLEELIQSVAGIQAESLIKDKYYAIYNEYNFLLGHYFRTLYSIIKFVDNSKLSDLDKKFYTNIIRAQLSEHELALLFYNCIYLDEAQEKFLPLVKKYKLLKHLHKNLLTNPVHRDLLSL